MRNNQQSGNAWFYVLLAVMIAVIAGLIYIMAGGSLPKIGDTRGVASPDIELENREIAQINVGDTGEFTDGLKNPTFSEQYTLDEFGAGIAERDIFDIDVNADGRIDRITRTRNENGTDHFYYEYKIELNQNGNFVDITPDGFRTTEGAECALQKLQFAFVPTFRVIKISRNWENSWTNPTMARRVEYTFNANQLTPSDPKELQIVCDVTDLF